LLIPFGPAYLLLALPALGVLRLWHAVLPPACAWATIARRRPRLAFTAGAVLLVLLAALALGAVMRARQVLSEVEAVAPGAWRAYCVTASQRIDSGPVQLAPSGTPPGVRQVSYPDAALLRFEITPRPGNACGLQRTLDGLTFGERYRLYLQIYDPGLDADPTESLLVSANDQVVWRRLPDTAEAGQWRYVSVPWPANASELTLRVERRAGRDPSQALDHAVAVRSLHLYPLY
jgi:hypothetical protein